MGNYSDSGSVLQLALVLFEHHAHQLAAGSDAGFVEQILQSRLDGALRSADPVGDFLVGQTFEDAAQNLLLALA